MSLGIPCEEEIGIPAPSKYTYLDWFVTVSMSGMHRLNLDHTRMAFVVGPGRWLSYIWARALIVLHFVG